LKAKHQEVSPVGSLMELPIEYMPKFGSTEIINTKSERNPFKLSKKVCFDEEGIGKVYSLKHNTSESLT